MNRERQKEKALELLNRVTLCNTDEELECVLDAADECVQAGLITKKSYRAIEEAINDRGVDLVEIQIKEQIHAIRHCFDHIPSLL